MLTRVSQNVRCMVDTGYLFVHFKSCGLSLAQGLSKLLILHLETVHMMISSRLPWIHVKHARRDSSPWVIYIYEYFICKFHSLEWMINLLKTEHFAFLLIDLLMHVCLEGQEHTCAQEPGTLVLLIQVCQESAAAPLADMWEHPSENRKATWMRIYVVIRAKYLKTEATIQVIL